jgi:hypothetical protein
MLATLTHRRFSSPDWIYERKLDGERCLAFRRGGEVRLLSRNRRRLDCTYPELVDALKVQRDHDVVVDGEVVAFEGGQMSFSRLQRRMGSSDPELARRSGIAVSYYIFDILHLDGNRVTALPVRARKSLLARAVTFRTPLRLTTHRNTEGEAFFRDACRRGWEEDLRVEGDRLQALVGHQRIRGHLHGVDGEDLGVQAVGESRAPVTGVRRAVGAVEPEHDPVRRSGRPHVGTGARRARTAPTTAARSRSVPTGPTASASIRSGVRNQTVSSYPR